WKNKHPTSICLKHWLSNSWITFFVQEAILKLPHSQYSMSNSMQTQLHDCSAVIYLGKLSGRRIR
ncbi:hypothetical protein, partial [Sphingobacterium multivorum]|uniref:hypothetical protein n=1 Tax=Sphingobacterium multivorum TaxID=28454 RepID=UPI0028962F28